MLINPSARHDPAYQWFAEARFGMFIHFSLASMFGEDLGANRKFGAAYKEYEAKANEFNPAKLNAKEWIDVAEDAGCKYIVYTAKHTEGFCMWDTKTTDWNIMNTPFGRDIVGELAEECHQRSMRLGIYVGTSEWHSPYRPNHPKVWGDRDWSRDDDEPDLDKHHDYLCRQLTELLSNYGQVDCIWWDGCEKSEKYWRGKKLYEHIKSLQPDCIVNDRVKYGDYITPEWHLREDIDSDKYLIESCISVARNGWGWNKGSGHRTTAECLDLLVKMAGCGSNLLLNVGPDADGVIPAAEQERMRGMGEWLKDNGEAVYGTNALKLDDMPDEMRATRKGNDVYLLFRRWPRFSEFEVPQIRSLPTAAELLGGGVLRCEMRDEGLFLRDLPARAADELPKVIRLAFDGEPSLRKAAAPVRLEHVITVKAGQATQLPARYANSEGFGVKHRVLRVEKLLPPDAALSMPARKDLFLYQDLWELNRYAITPSEEWATVNWHSLEQKLVWHVESDAAMRVTVSIRLRCPKEFAGTSYDLRCGESTCACTVAGNAVEESEGPDWFKGWYQYPFVWETAGTLEIPAGRSRLEMQPTDFVWGTYFADVAELKIEKESKRA